MVYFATSMAPLGGWWLGRVIDGIDWRAGLRKGMLWLMLMVPLFLVALKAVLPDVDAASHSPTSPSPA